MILPGEFHSLTCIIFVWKYHVVSYKIPSLNYSTPLKLLLNKDF